MKKCICGQDLSEGTEARAAVEGLISEQTAIDSQRKSLTALYHHAKMLAGEAQSRQEKGESWLYSYRDLVEQRLSNTKMLRTRLDEERTVDATLKTIDEQHIEQLEKLRDALRADITKKQTDLQNAQIDLDSALDECERLREEWKTIEKQHKQQTRLQNRLVVARDLEKILARTLIQLQDEYVDRVSKRMSQMFLEMVGADPAVAGGVFGKALISPTYEIQVQDPDGTILDPDHELNGASKRALTFSFIWALTEVSGVSAPRVIDTPLGMMSGGVKRRVVELITEPRHGQQGSDFQVVLFLTRQEISTVEHLLDERAGSVCTFTNSANYPTDLVNDPGTQHAAILMCNCDHRTSCGICQRRDDEAYQLNNATA